MKELGVVARIVVVAFVWAVLAAATQGSASAAVIKSRQPCVAFNKVCRLFNWTDPIPIIRAFAFRAPTTGTAQVTFHGTMVCDNGGATTDKVAALVGQIVTDKNAKPDGIIHNAAFSVVFVR